MSRATTNYPRPPKKSAYPKTSQSNMNGCTNIAYVRDGRVFTYVPTPQIQVRRTETLSGYSGKRLPYSFPPPINGLSTQKTVEAHTLSEVVLPGDSSYIREVMRFNPRGLSGLSDIDPTLEPSVEADADSRLTSKILGQLLDQNVNLGQVISERHQTIALFASTARRIATAAYSFRKGNWQAACEHLGYRPSRKQRARLQQAKILFSKDQRQLLANSILEVQYGIRPLLSDVYGAAQHLAERTYMNNDRNTFVVSATAFSQGSRSRQKNVTIRGQYTSGQVTLPLTMLYTKTYRTKKRVYFRVSSPLARELNQLGLTNPAVLAWEAMPWSFVVDWIVPIGNWLANLTATTGLSFVAGMTTKEWDRTCRYFTSVSESKHNYHNYERIRDTGFPVPSLPRLKNPLGVDHIVNSIALLQGAFFRRNPT